VIRVQNLSKRFGAFTAADGIAFEVAAGEIFASRQLGSATSRAGARCRQSKPAHKRPSGATQRNVASHFLGPNGAGKTTTIKMLTTLLRASAGTSRQLGSATSRAGQRATVPLVRRQSKPARKRPAPGPPAPCAEVAAGATQRKVASRIDGLRGAFSQQWQFLPMLDLTLLAAAGTVFIVAGAYCFARIEP